MIPLKSLKMKVQALLVSLLLLTAVQPVAHVHAAVPSTMSYQGILKDNSGNYLTGTYAMVFKLYSASSGGSALWTETQSSVSVSSGKFNVVLGSVTPISVDFTADYWLGITVGADSEMTPRVKLNTIGYAFMAQKVVDGFTQTQHDALSHRNIEGVKENTTLIAKTNFKIDAYSAAVANNMGAMMVDVFTDASGINAGSSSDYVWRSSPNYDVIVNTGGIDSNTVLMLHGNGTNGSTSFTDSSSGGKTVTANGSAQVSTAQSKFGGAAASFTGSSGTYLTVPDSADFNFGTGNFTVDFWVRFNAITVEDGLIGISNTASGQDLNNTFILRIDAGNSSNMQFYLRSGGTTLIDQTVAHGMSTGNWYHIALIRGWGGNANSWAVTVNGSSIMTFTSSATVPDFTSNLRIGDDPRAGNSPLNGYLDEIRISKGVARWTSGFTPPTSEYTTPASSATVISNTYTQNSAPIEAMIIADETLGTGSIAYSVSRDNGTTWTTCTKETVCSISSQPSGTNVKWKAVITGDAELNGVAVAV